MLSKAALVIYCWVLCLMDSQLTIKISLVLLKMLEEKGIKKQAKPDTENQSDSISAFLERRTPEKYLFMSSEGEREQIQVKT